MRENNREAERIAKIKNLEDRETINNNNGESKKKQDKEKQDEESETDEADHELFSQNKKPRTVDKSPRRAHRLSEMRKRRDVRSLDEIQTVKK
eukprot:5870992-Heterocapsa_arctica.AAC.1